VAKRKTHCKRGHKFNAKSRAWFKLKSGYIIQRCRICRSEYNRVKYWRIKMINADNLIEASPWHPMSNPIDLKHLGKFGEELGECSSAVSRCIIQGINECEPTTKVSNKDWLTDEIADILANAELVIKRFNLSREFISNRMNKKIKHLQQWHDKA
jgi:hypothetical protein